MVTHDVDEAVLLSDKIVMLTNGPSATIGEILEVKLARPRERVALAQDLCTRNTGLPCWSSCITVSRIHPRKRPDKNGFAGIGIRKVNFVAPR